MFDISKLISALNYSETQETTQLKDFFYQSETKFKFIKLF